MTKRVEAVAPLMAALEPTLGIAIDEAWRPQIIAFLAMAAANVDLYADLPFDDASDEQAAVFRPGDAQ